MSSVHELASSTDYGATTNICPSQPIPRVTVKNTNAQNRMIRYFTHCHSSWLSLLSVVVVRGGGLYSALIAVCGSALYGRMRWTHASTHVMAWNRIWWPRQFHVKCYDLTCSRKTSLTVAEGNIAATGQQTLNTMLFPRESCPRLYNHNYRLLVC